MEWREGLRAFRGRHFRPAEVPTSKPLMFVLCSENTAGAALAAAFQPAIVLQTLALCGSPSDAGVRGTVEYAVRIAGVRSIVVVGHDGCRGASMPGSRTAGEAFAVAQALAFRRDELLGPLLEKHRVTVYPICLNEREGDVYRCDIEGRPSTLLDDVELDRFLAACCEAPS